MREHFDVIIIGAGIVGTLIARVLSRFDIRILLLEREADVGMRTSSANSRIIHAGYDPLPGTLKAEMNVKGNLLWGQLAGELGIPFRQHTTHVVAIDQMELPRLEELLTRGKANGVSGLRIISGEEMRHREPKINPAVCGALRAETAGICDPWAATVAVAENAILNGVTLKLSTTFKDFVMRGTSVQGVETDQGFFGCRWAINAAGLYADDVMHRLNVRPEFRMTPRRGEYFILGGLCFATENTLWPVPTETSKGIGVTATIYGNTIIGSNSHMIEDKEDWTVTAAGLSEVRQGSLRLIPDLNLEHSAATFAGLRASGNAPCANRAIPYTGDFVIEIPENVSGFVNIAGIESPGLTAAPAIAMRVVELLRDSGERLNERPDWNPLRRACSRSLGQLRPIQASF